MTDPTDLLRRIVAAWDEGWEPISRCRRLHPLITEARDLIAQPVPERPLGVCSGCGTDRRHPRACCPDCDCIPFVPFAQPVLGDLTSTDKPDTIDAAWARVEAALPYGTWVAIQTPTAGEPAEPGLEWCVGLYGNAAETMDVVEFYGPTPQAALHALADALEATK